MRSPIQFVDLQGQYAAIREEVDAALAAVFDCAVFVGGQEVAAFEAEFAAYCEVEHCVGVASGTDALFLALWGLGVGAGDEVITTTLTFVATTEAILRVGARPVLVDVDPNTLLMDPDAVAAAVTSRTKAIVAVHLYGQPVEMQRLVDVARRHGLKIVEDAAQAHGARLGGRRVGSLGDVACFSFYPSKNLGAYGDGGAIVTSDADLAARVRMLANHGRITHCLHETAGMNSRLDALQAAVLRVKLRHLDGWNEARRRIASVYTRMLEGVPSIVTPTVRPDVAPVWHLYVVQCPDRDELREHLKRAGVSSAIHYPIPVHLQPAYVHLGYEKGCFPVSEAACQRLVSLPIFPELGEDGAAYVAETVREFATRQVN